MKAVLFLALRRAGRLIREAFDQPKEVRTKHGSSINLVTSVDTAADALIRRTILRAYPDHDLLTEESPPTRRGSPYKWIIDPLDGTTNFAHSYPQVGVSIGLEYQGRLILAGVLDPMRRELFWAERGRGAWLSTPAGQRRLRVSATRRLKGALLLTGFPYDRRERVDLYLSYVRAFMQRIQGIRRAGAASLDLCWTACGRVDGYWEWRLKPWDVAAGSLILTEAGGRMSDFAGRPYSVYGEQTLATNGRIHAEMIGVMRRLEGGGKA